MKNDDIYAFRMLIEYALRESANLNEPVISHLLNMTLEEIASLSLASGEIAHQFNSPPEQSLSN